MNIYNIYIYEPERKATAMFKRKSSYRYIRVILPYGCSIYVTEVSRFFFRSQEISVNNR